LLFSHLCFNYINQLLRSRSYSYEFDYLTYLCSDYGLPFLLRTVLEIAFFYNKLKLLFPLFFIRLLNNLHDHVKAIPILLHITFIVIFLESFKDLSLHLVKL
jgi:hypothetical protein